MVKIAQKYRILIVEDEGIVARDIAQQLQELGYEVAGHTTHGEQAVHLAQELGPDLILMDIQLAGVMDGITAASQIRAQSGLPVVFLTAFAADEVLERAKMTEPYGYILKPFSDRELRTVLSMALYKHKAEARLQESAAQLRALSRRVLEVQEAERRKLAIELHDELGQSLTAIKINLQTHERFQGQPAADFYAENISIVEDILQKVRGLALALRPSMLDDLGLGAALHWIARQTAERCGFSVRFFAERSLERLPAEVETACFRIVQEALTNISRHANASTVEIELSSDGSHLTLCVHDDGSGFDVPDMQQRASKGASIGILGMQERASLIGGQLDIASVPGKGSTVRLQFPLPLSEIAAA